MAYATYTGTRRNIARLRDAGWRWFLTPDIGHRRNLHGMGYAIDNGAWGAHRSGSEWSAENGFSQLVAARGAGADFIVVPDIVEGGAASLARSVEWLPWCLDRCRRVLVAVQDGMTPGSVRGMLSDRVGVFVGGSTEWKISTMRSWAGAARAAGAWCHVGRVNSVQRINVCLGAGVDSFDGTNATRFSVNVGRLDAARRQGVLL